MKSKIILYTGLFVFTVMINRISAQTTGTLGVLSYSIEAGEATITDCDASATEAIIPDVISGFPVTTIGEFSFSFCDSISVMTIPSSVTNVGDYAFAGCSNLGDIIFEGSAPNMGAFVFSNVSEGSRAFVSNEHLATFGEAGSEWNELIITNRSGSIGSLSYEITPIGAIITDCHFAVTEMIVPEYILGFPVSSIGDNAFEDCVSLTDLTLPDSIISFGGNAFGNCSSLLDFNMPSSLISIGYAAFNRCDKLTSINLPEGLISIGRGAFNYCENLQNVSIPNSVTSIGAYAFAYSRLLDNITIPAGVSNIEAQIFRGCSGLKNITISEGVTSIGDQAFESCTSLTEVTLPPGVTVIGDYAFWACRDLTDIELPESLTEIGDNAFAICDNLTSLQIPDGVTKIGSGAFRLCSKLISVTIPSGVTVIKDKTFEDCYLLSNVLIPSGVTSIERYAFAGCRNLENITIPEGVLSIGSYAFKGCDNLVRVWFEGSAPSIGTKPFHGNPFSYAVVTESQNLESFGGEGSTWNGLYVISPTGTIGDLSYEITDNQVVITDCDLTAVEVIIPETSFGLPVTRVADSAFSDCNSLESVTIPSTVTSIGPSAFSGCISLINTILPSSISSIEDAAFSGCSSLVGIYFRGNAPSVGKNAFLGVSPEAKAVVIDPLMLPSFGGVGANWNGILVGGLTGIQGDLSYEIHVYPSGAINVFIIDCSLTAVDVEIPETILGGQVIEIDTSAFENCTMLTHVSIPLSVTRIGYRAFLNCTSLTTITIPRNVTHIGGTAFAYCGDLIGILFEGSAPNVYSNTFLDIAPSAQAVVPDTQNLSTFGGEGSVWNGLVVSTSFKLGDLTYSISINQVTVADCELTATLVNIPETIFGLPVATIGESAFYNCNNLSSIFIPEGVTRIEANAFLFCSGLSDITIPGSIVYIGDSAFLFCSDIKSVWFKGEAPNVGTNPFSGVDSAARAYIAAGSLASFGGEGTSWNGLLVSEHAFDTFLDAVQYAEFSASDALPSSDPLNRGVPNAVAHSLGISLVGNLTDSQRSRLPKPVPSQHGAPVALGFSLPANAPSDVTYFIEVCTNLQLKDDDWTEVAVKTGAGSWAGVGADRISQSEEQYGFVATTVEFPTEYTEIGFIRMRVEIN